jgi:hypothetical protein
MKHIKLFENFEEGMPNAEGDGMTTGKPSIEEMVAANQKVFDAKDSAGGEMYVPTYKLEDLKMKWAYNSGVYGWVDEMSALHGIKAEDLHEMDDEFIRYLGSLGYSQQQSVPVPPLEWFDPNHDMSNQTYTGDKIYNWK